MYLLSSFGAFDDFGVLVLLGSFCRLWLMTLGFYFVFDFYDVS